MSISCFAVQSTQNHIVECVHLYMCIQVSIDNLVSVVWEVNFCIHSSMHTCGRQEIQKVIVLLCLAT